VSFIRVIHIIDPRPCCCWSQKRPQGQRGLSCWCHSPALLHSRTDRESGGSCRGWFAAPARRAAPRALDIAQRTRDHGRRDRHGEWAAAAKVGWGCSATARRRSWPRAAAAAIKSYILDKSTNSYVYVIKDRFYVHMCIVGAKARQENVVSYLHPMTEYSRSCCVNDPVVTISNYCEKDEYTTI